MRALVRKFDYWLCQWMGGFPFCSDPECLVKLQVTRAHHAMTVDGLEIKRGDPVLAIHLWNEHLPPLPGKEIDLAWAVKTQRMFRSSLRKAAIYIKNTPPLMSLRAVMGVTSLFPPPEKPGEWHPMQRFGFTVIFYRSRLGRFGEFWENFYAWLLANAYNPISLWRWGIFKRRRAEIWISMSSFLNRFGGEST
ncbi:hypothetical protein ATHL_01454 [Anaerolinea thermolimosa]|nr:hypothetical protein ATHL_01454 [Anaerolinea thermolimosa]